MLWPGLLCDPRSVGTGLDPAQTLSFGGTTELLELFYVKKASKLEQRGI